MRKLIPLLLMILGAFGLALALISLTAEWTKPLPNPEACRFEPIPEHLQERCK